MKAKSGAGPDGQARAKNTSRTPRARRAEDILRSIVADVEAMNVRGPSNYWFGNFTDFKETIDGEMKIYWPNLGILIQEAKARLGSTE